MQVISLQHYYVGTEGVINSRQSYRNRCNEEVNEYWDIGSIHELMQLYVYLLSHMHDYFLRSPEGDPPTLPPLDTDLSPMNDV